MYDGGERERTRSEEQKANNKEKKPIDLGATRKHNPMSNGQTTDPRHGKKQFVFPTTDLLLSDPQVARETRLQQFARKASEKRVLLKGLYCKAKEPV